MHAVKEAEETPGEMPLLRCRDLHLGYRVAHGWRPVVHGVNLDIAEGRTVALVGESGSGKSTIAKALVKLIPLREGSIWFAGEEISGLNAEQFVPWRKRIQMIFQDPWRALNPRLTVEDLLGEPLRIHFPRMKREERRSRIEELLSSVHLPQDCLRRYPAEFSGGQRQRILVARALAVEPELLICDEPVSALDVSIQAKLLELLAELKAARGLTLLFISHDLAVVQQIADHVVVLQKGRIAESQSVESLFQDPRHSYTRLLIEACPKW